MNKSGNDNCDACGGNGFIYTYDANGLASGRERCPWCSGAFDMSQPAGRHLYRDLGYGPSICGSDEQPTISITPEQFHQQLGTATGRDVKFFIEDPPAICALCATRYIDEQKR